MAKRAYCKNTVKGSQRGRKYPPKVRAEVLMAMLSSGSICAVARRYGVPESTIRSWMAEEAGRSDAFAKERQAAAREIAIRASLGARAQVSYLQSRVDESQRAAQVQAKLHRKLDEDTRARCFAVGTLLKSDAEELADATETGLVLYAAEDSYDRQLEDEERKLLDAQLERYGQERRRHGHRADDRGRKGCGNGTQQESERGQCPTAGGDRGRGPGRKRAGGDGGWNVRATTDGP